MDKLEVHHQLEQNVPDEKLFAYIKDTLKSRYKIGMLSNAGANWLDEIFTPEQIKLFDAVALSFETGFIKPDPRAFETIAQKLGVQPQECILIDDQEHYCAAARETGMQAIYHHTTPQTITELEALLT
jgi:putative hydrolase of the HAD superfamily